METSDVFYVKDKSLSWRYIQKYTDRSSCLSQNTKFCMMQIFKCSISSL